jgi:hypothetical protein
MFSKTLKIRLYVKTLLQIIFKGENSDFLQWGKNLNTQVLANKARKKIEVATWSIHDRI